MSATASGRRATHRNLQKLDLAAVLRVLDQNWNELAGWSRSRVRPATGPELQSVRNRWAHAPGWRRFFFLCHLFFATAPLMHSGTRTP
ncbi:MAG: hypothetical protein IPH43_11285 [Xanthomonadales bacterium]|nr:hypothetical protein [Xanthomonadales bacterium]